MASAANAKILRDELSLVRETAHSFEEVCKGLLKRESPLIEAVSVVRLDCMGTTIDAGDFCRKEHESNPTYARAIVDAKSKKVKCKLATRAIISFDCASNQSLCKDKEIGCYKLGELYATNLAIAHASIIEEKNLKKLNCFFSSAKPHEVVKPRFQDL